MTPSCCSIVPILTICSLISIWIYIILFYALSCPQYPLRTYMHILPCCSHITYLHVLIVVVSFLFFLMPLPALLSSLSLHVVPMLMLSYSQSQFSLCISFCPPAQLNIIPFFWCFGLFSFFRREIWECSLSSLKSSEDKVRK